MLTSHRRSQNYSDPVGGQTLFEFLKRKKKFALQVSLSKSRKQNVRPAAQSYSPKKRELKNTFDETLDIESNIKCQTQRQKNRQCTTPYKFQSTNPAKKNKHTSFIEMISPARKKQDKSLTPERNKRQNVSRDHKTKSQLQNKDQFQNIKKKVQQTFYRKNLNRSITVMKQTLLKFINDGKIIKEKFHTFFVELKPILKYVEDGSNRNFSQRAEQVKLKLRSFQHLFKQFDVQNGNQIIENMHRNLSEHIISLQGKIRSQLQKNDITTLTKIKQNKDIRIVKLNDEIAVLQKDLELTRRRLEKSERINQKLKDQGTSSTLQQNTRLSAKQNAFQEKIAQYQEQINCLASQLDTFKQKQKQLQKKVKDATYLKQQAQKRFVQQSTKIKSTKQQYLLNEIQMLKKQFKNDMKQITVLYQQKQQDSLAIIQKLKKQKAQLVITIQNIKGNQNRNSEEVMISKTQSQKLKKQNECLVTDLNRMNQELYQHWLALKDIRTLAVRLHIFPKFQRIYCDLPFNDQLFI